MNIQKIKYHEDNKAQRLINCIPNNKRCFQVNINRVKSKNTITAWHCHNLQDDLFIVIKGSFKVGLVNSSDVIPGHNNSNKVKWTILTEAHYKPQSLVIPARVWHGVKSLEDDSIILYYMSKEYNKDDIYELPIGHFGEIW